MFISYDDNHYTAPCFLVFVVLLIFMLSVLFLVTVINLSLFFKGNFLCTFFHVPFFLFFFLTHRTCVCYRSGIKTCASLLAFLSFGPFVEVLFSSIFKNVHFDEISPADLGFEESSRSPDSLFSYFSFICTCLMMFFPSIPKY